MNTYSTMEKSSNHPADEMDTMETSSSTEQPEVPQQPITESNETGTAGTSNAEHVDRKRSSAEPESIPVKRRPDFEVLLPSSSEGVPSQDNSSSAEAEPAAQQVAPSIVNNAMDALTHQDEVLEQPVVEGNETGPAGTADMEHMDQNTDSNSPSAETEPAAQQVVPFIAGPRDNRQRASSEPPSIWTMPQNSPLEQRIARSKSESNMNDQLPNIAFALELPQLHRNGTSESNGTVTAILSGLDQSVRKIIRKKKTFEPMLRQILNIPDGQRTPFAFEEASHYLTSQANQSSSSGLLPLRQSTTRRASEAEREHRIPRKFASLRRDTMKDDIRKILEYPTQKYPTSTCVPTERVSFVFDQDSKYAVQLLEKDARCIFCGLAEGALTRCHASTKGFPANKACQSLFHTVCISHYNADRFNCQFSSRKDCADGVFCPLHNCATCSIERRVEKSFIGELVECVRCFRAYHVDSCLPAGYKMFEVKRVIYGQNFEYSERSGKMILCPNHIEEINFTQGKHSKICMICNKKDEEAGIECATCAEYFHERCREVKEMFGGLKKNQCDACVCRTTFQLDMPVLYNKDEIWKIAIARKWTHIDQSKDIGKLKNFGKLGYVLLELKKEREQGSHYKVKHVRQVVELQKEMLNVGEQDHENWLKMLESCTKDKMSTLPELPRKTFRPITKCVERHDVDYEEQLADRELCRCEGPLRCTTMACRYRQIESECPVACEQDGLVCHNRKVANSYRNPNMEVRGAGKRGRGLFATADIAEGEYLLEYVGEIISNETRDERKESARQDLDSGHYMMTVDSNNSIDALRKGNDARFINHSCDPNADSRKTQVYYKPTEPKPRKQRKKPTQPKEADEELNEVDEPEERNEVDQPEEPETSDKKAPTRRSSRVRKILRPEIELPLESGPSVKSVPRLYFFAIKSIKKDEEITFNYKMVADKGESVISCTCKALICAHTLAGPKAGAKSESPEIEEPGQPEEPELLEEQGQPEEPGQHEEPQQPREPEQLAEQEQEEL